MNKNKVDIVDEVLNNLQPFYSGLDYDSIRAPVWEYFYLTNMYKDFLMFDQGKGLIWYPMR